MTYKNAESLKALIKNQADKLQISPFLMLQYYMFERLLKRISLSEYRTNFVLKGGFLISSMVGVNDRMTQDLDSAVYGMELTSEKITDALNEIFTINTDDGINYVVEKVKPIQIINDKPGYRVSIQASYENIVVPLSIDFSIALQGKLKDVIYPYHSLLDGELISVRAYSLETTLVEKLDAIVKRGTRTTRSRDFYDVYTIATLYASSINHKAVFSALQTLCKSRSNKNYSLKEYKANIQEIMDSEYQRNLWEKYQHNYAYASDISFDDICLAMYHFFDLKNTNE